jgi:predicted site-specific integrase-resolvase
MTDGNGVLAEYMSEAELAAQLGISTRTLIRWRRLGMGPAFTKMVRRILYPRAAVLEWLASQHKAS